MGSARGLGTLRFVTHERYRRPRRILSQKRHPIAFLMAWHMQASQEQPPPHEQDRETVPEWSQSSLLDGGYGGLRSATTVGTQ